MKYIRIAALLYMACLIGGSCSWNQYLGNPERTAYCDGQIDSPEVLWETALPGKISDPLIVNDRIIVLCRPQEGFPAPPSKATIAVVDLLTGIPMQSVAPEEDLVEMFATGDDKVLGVTLTALYEIDLPSESFSRLLRIYANSAPHPAVLPDRIVFHWTPVTCLSTDDYSTLWDLRTSLGSSYPQDASTRNVAASPKRVFVILETGEDMRVWAVDSSTGELIWVSDTFKVWEIAVTDSTVFIGGKNVYALDAETGKVMWKVEIEGSLRSNIVVEPDAIYFTNNMELYSVDMRSGAVKWKVLWEGIPFWITHLLGIGNTIICSDIRNMTAFSTKDGTRQWNVHFQDYAVADVSKTRPVFVDGIIVVGGSEQSNSLVAFASDPELFVEQGDAFVSGGQKEKAGQSYGKAFSLYEKKGERKKAEEIRKKAQELGIPLQLPPASQSPPLTEPPPSVSPSPSPSTPPSESPSPSAPPTVSTPLLEKSKIIVLSVAAVILVILAAYYFKRKRKTI